MRFSIGSSPYETNQQTTHVTSWAILLSLHPHLHVLVLVNLDVNDVWATANGAVLDVLLRRTCRQVDRHHDFLPAGIAVVAGLVLHLYVSRSRAGLDRECCRAWHVIAVHNGGGQAFH